MVRAIIQRTGDSEYILLGSTASKVGLHCLGLKIAVGPSSDPIAARPGHIAGSVSLQREFGEWNTQTGLHLNGTPSLGDTIEYYLFEAVITGFCLPGGPSVRVHLQDAANKAAMARAAEFILREVMLVTFDRLASTTYQPSSDSDGIAHLVFCFAGDLTRVQIPPPPTATAPSTAPGDTGSADALSSVPAPSVAAPRDHATSASASLSTLYSLIHTTNRALPESASVQQTAGESWVGHMLPGCKNDSWIRPTAISVSNTRPAAAPQFGVLTSSDAVRELYIAAVWSFLWRNGEHDKDFSPTSDSDSDGAGDDFLCF